MRNAIASPTKYQKAKKIYIVQFESNSIVVNPSERFGVGTPGSPFSPPVYSDSGLNSTKKKTSAIATVIMAK